MSHLHEDPDEILDRDGNEIVDCGDGPHVSFIVYRNKATSEFDIVHGTFTPGTYKKSWHEELEKNLKEEGISFERIIAGRVWPNHKLASTYESKDEVMDYKDLIEKMFKNLKLDIRVFKWDYAGSANYRDLEYWPTAFSSTTSRVVPSTQAKKLINHLIQKIHLADPVEKKRIRQQIKALQMASGISDADIQGIEKTYADKYASQEKEFGSVAAAQFARGSIAENSGEDFAIVGIVSPELDVVGTKYTETSANMIKHSQLRSIYQTDGKSWRYYSDKNFVGWYDPSTQDEKEAVTDWLKTKHNIREPLTHMNMLMEAKMRIYNKTLDPNLWNENFELDQEARQALLKIGKDFYEGTDLQGEILNIYMIGSSANYNWTPASDIDVHVVIDISKENINPKYARKFMDSLGSAWNSSHDIEVKGHPVEVYLQDQTEKNGSPETARPGVAIFSLIDNKWVQKPTHNPPTVDKEKIKTKYREVKERIENLIGTDDYTGLKALMKRIRNYRNAGLQANGEFGTENLVFKALRHTGMLEKLKDAIQSIYDKKASIDESIGGQTFIVTGMTSQDLDVAGEKYTGNDPMITHGSVISKYGNWSGAATWRYRSDNNTLFWWGSHPDEDVIEATVDWLARKYNVRKPRHIASSDYAHDYHGRSYYQLKKKMHYPWAESYLREGDFDEFYVVGVITSDLDVYAKRYDTRNNYITHNELYRLYGLDFGTGAGWRYHSVGNWIFWWDVPSDEQKEEVLNYLKSKYKVLNPKNEYPKAVHPSEFLKEAVKKQNYILVGLTNQDLQSVAVKDYGKPYEKGGGLEGGMLVHSIEHKDLPRLKGGSGYPFRKQGDEANWRYKSSNNTLYIHQDDPAWGSICTPMMRDAILDYLHTKYNIVNPKINRDKDAIFRDGHFIDEIVSTKKDFIIIGNINDDYEVNGVKKTSPDDSPNHSGWGKRWRYRSTLPQYVFWWEIPDEDDKESVEFFLYKKYGIKVKKHRLFYDYGRDMDNISSYLHGVRMKKPFVNEAVSESDIYVGSINTDDLMVKALPRKRIPKLGSHMDLHRALSIYGEQWDDFRYRKDINTVFTKGPFSDVQKEAIKFWIEKNLRMDTTLTKFVDYSYNPHASMKAHGLDDDMPDVTRDMDKWLDEAKFDPFKAKKLQFVTYGGLSLTKQKGFKNDPDVSFHSPPARRGIYAFIWPYVEKFLLGGYSDPKERGKGQRQRIQYLRDKEGNVITSDNPEYEKLSDIPKNWSLKRKRKDAPGKDFTDDEFEWDKEYYSVLFRNTPRKKFSYNGPIWHHLKDKIKPHEILDEKGEWVKTDMEPYHKAFLRELQSMEAYKFRHGMGFTMDHLEVFIDQKI